MTKSGGLNLRVSVTHLRGEAALIMQLSAAAPAATTVAFALDFSDSFAGIAKSLECCTRLVESFPREWPVWIYRLSDPLPLALDVTVAHLLDRSVELTKLLRDRSFMLDASGRGSFLRPVVEDIASRLHRAEVTEVWLLVLTDGLLTDFASPVGNDVKALRIAAVMPNAVAGPLRQWTRLMSEHPAFSLNDSELDDWLGMRQLPIHGACSVSVVSGPGCTSFRLEGSHRLDPVNGCFGWDSRGGPLVVVHMGAKVEQARIDVKQLSTGRRVTLGVADAEGPVTASFLQAMEQSSPGGFHDALRVLLDLRDGDPAFPLAWAAAGRAMVASSRYAPARMEMKAMSPAVEEALRTDAAALCICRGDPSTEAPRGARLVVIQLVRDTPICWTSGDTLPFGTAEDPIKLGYDRLESRWVLRTATNPAVYLNPKGGQRLPNLRMRQDQAEWTAFFSGEI